MKIYEMMRLKHINPVYLLAGVLVSFIPIFSSAQGKIYDPLLDPSCKIVKSDAVEKWNCTYMWYPGMLAAYMQEHHRQTSKARCVNVDYPGTFFQRSNVTFFRKTVKLQKETTLKWAGFDVIQCTIDGQLLDQHLRSCNLKPGSHHLLFEINTENRLPALIVQGDGIEELKGWQVSLDNRIWNNPETDTRYNKPSVHPDTEQEITVAVLPKKYIFLRNASESIESLDLGEKAQLVVDFDHLEIGVVKLKVRGTGNLSFCVGESVDEALSDNPKGFEQYAIPVTALTGNVQEILLPERALRYLRIESEKSCTITSIRMDARIWPVNFLMQFACDNEKLNDLWNAGVATLHTSMHNFYLDGVKRDYLPWSMDAIISMIGGDYVFGDRQVARNGLSVSLMPPNPQATDWGIVDYPLHALVGFKHDYMRYGDLTTSLLYKERIIQQLALYESVLDKNGLLSAPSAPHGQEVATSVDENSFIAMSGTTSGFIPGWSKKEGPDVYGTPAYAQILLYQNFKTGAYFARLWKENKLAAGYERSAEQLRKNILTHFWDDERKAFVNGYRSDGEKDMRISHHAQYWAILAGIYPEQYYDILFDEVLPSIPSYKEYISYEKGYELLAYIKAGRIKDMFALLDLVWGDWLRQGHTRFPENFSYSAPVAEQLEFYRRPFGLSLCHGANGVPPIVAVLNGIMGFSQSDKHISEYTITPQLLNLKWVKGRIPVKEGYITLDLKRNGVSTVEVPANCTVRVMQNDGNRLLFVNKPGKYEFTLK